MKGHSDIKASSRVQCTLDSHNYWMRPALVNTHSSRRRRHTCIVAHSPERSEQSLLFSPRYSFIYLRSRRERQQGREPRPAVANDGAGFLSATTSILSELDDSASQRHRSVGGFLLRLAAYVKRILHHQKSTATHFVSKL